MSVAVKPDAVHDADAFLRILGDRHTFQTFDDTGRGRKFLNRILHGTLAEHTDTLALLNARGAGVFVMVNAGDGNGRKTANVKTVRALFVDLDGAPLEPIMAAPLAPHCIVESSPGRWHAYWRVSDCPLSDFTPLQKELAAEFNGDEKVCDLPRVMRLPGFDHRKRAPYRSRIVELRAGCPYSVADFRGAFGFAAMPALARTPRTLPERIPEGERNTTFFSLARGLVQKGFDAGAINGRLQRINAERCDPPLCATEVDEIAARAIAYGSDGFTILTDTLLNSQEWKALPSPSRWIIVTALRRYNGSNNGNIALTHTDCRMIEGCADEKDFIRYRRLAVESGILILAERGHMTRDGKTPGLYAIAVRFLVGSHTGQIPQLAHTGQIPPSYIEKQSFTLLSPLSPSRNKTPSKAA